MADIDVRFGATVGPLLSGIKEAEEAITSLRAPVDAFVEGLRGVAEAAGAAFVIDKLADWVSEITEAAERTTILASAIGTTSAKLSEFQNLTFLAGGETQNLVRIATMLGHELQVGISKPLSDQGQAIRAAKIDIGQLTQALKDPIDTIMLLREAWQRLPDDFNRLDIFRSLVGPRGLTALAPILTKSAEEIRALGQASRETGADLSGQQLTALADTWAKVHELELAITGLKSHILLDFKEPIDQATTSLTHFIETVTRMGTGTSLVEGFFNYIKTNLDEDKREIQAVIDGFEWLKTHDIYGNPIDQAGKEFPIPPREAGSASHEGRDVAAAASGYSGNAAVVADALRSIGASAEAIAGIIQNLQRESNITPGAVNPSSGATGIAQWLGDRLTALKAAEGPAWNTLQGQVDFLIKEFQGKFASVFAAANKATTQAQAEAIIRTGFEKPGPGVGPGGGGGSTFDPEATRLAYARQVAAIDVQIRQAVYNEDYAAATAALAKKKALLDSEKEDTASVITEQERLREEADRNAQQSRQRAAETTIKTIQTEEAAELKAVQTRRQLGTMSIGDAEAAEQQIVLGHAVAIAQILKSEADAAGTRQSIRQQIADKAVELETQTAAKLQQIQEKAAEQEKQVLDSLLKPITQSLASGITGVLYRRETPAQAGEKIGETALTDALDKVMSKATNILENAIVSLLPQAMKSLLGIGEVTAETTAIVTALTTAGPAANAIAMTPVLEAQTAQLGAILTGILIKPSVLGTTFAMGGIVPAAAGGWQLPSSFGSDRVLAALTPGEMVLPTDTTNKVLNGFGAGGGGAGDTHYHFHGPVFDAQGVRKWAMQHSDALAAGVGAGSRNFHPALASMRP